MSALPPIEQQIQMAMRYTVHFTRDLFVPHNPLLARIVHDEQGSPPRVLFVVDRGVVDHHPRLLPAIDTYCRHTSLLQGGLPLLVPGGEAIKNDPTQIIRICEAVNAAGLCRHSYLAAIGGGAVLDAVGLAAALAHRGVRLIRVPTTVLAQCDSGVGVKNAINAFDKKNFLGSFAPPYAVLNDADFLTTLPPRDWRGGLAEAVKVALIMDADYFAFLEAHIAALVARDLGVMRQAIYRCAVLHCGHIARCGDPFELGSSRPLDFGHWAAHRLEALTCHRLRHGEAVALGIALDTTYSHLVGLLDEASWGRVIALLRQLGFALYIPELEWKLEAPDHPRSLLRGLVEFREHMGGPLAVMLLRAIGEGVEVDEIDHELVRRSVRILADLNENAAEKGSASRRVSVGHQEMRRRHCSEDLIQRIVYAGQRLLHAGRD